MRRIGVALIANLCWLAAALLAVGGVLLFGVGPASAGLALVAAIGAVAGSLLVGQRADRAF